MQPNQFNPLPRPAQIKINTINQNMPLANAPSRTISKVNSLYFDGFSKQRSSGKDKEVDRLDFGLESKVSHFLKEMDAHDTRDDDVPQLKQMVPNFKYIGNTNSFFKWPPFAMTLK